ncbi:Trans-2-enoyl-CoA reductase [Lasiodiplodia theobromae]|uniref:enoyl-[acyl-carrier-protein] reductase n=1 Tax=Lasiodiplodia theobromae TaxID=45133 RepID=A0A5N5D6R0_9PEZI|nr:Trans-2-enoyl-CoA reductase [Lasiodiplodia theobromae]
MSATAQILTFSETSSDAARVVGVHTSSIPPTTPSLIPADAVLLRLLAFPINPQDLMAIAGRYPVKPVHHHADQPIPGNDGVARVEAVGAQVKHLQPGDHVIPKRHGLGTWRSHAVLPAADLLKVPAAIEPAAASLLKMGCAPAYLLLEDMRNLRPGDWVVLNAGRGVIPQMVTQFARIRGCRTISVIRGRGDFESVAQTLREIGADVVVSEEQLEQAGVTAHPELQAAVEQNRVVLALDAVFGASGERLAALLAPDGTFVNYGSLGGADGVLRLSQQTLFWKQIRFRNFRLSQQFGLRSVPEQESLLGWFGELLLQGRLKTPVVEKVAWDQGSGAADLSETVKRSLQLATEKPLGVKKQVFVAQV